MEIAGLSLLILASAVLTIRAKYNGPLRHVYIFKPLTTVLILLVALLAARAGNPLYKAAIVGGLLFSLAGDVLLMLPSDPFVPGLASFLLAHLFYIIAFASGGAGLSLGSSVPFLLVIVVMYGVFAPHLGKMRVPVLLYEVVIITMAWRAWVLAQTGVAGTLLALIGALLFVLSDSALAADRFIKPFKAVHVVVLGTYYCAQWLIALSI